MKEAKTADWRAIAVLLLPLTLLTGCPATTAPTINLDSEPTAEGLYDVAGIDADEVRARPDADLAQYSKILLHSIDIEYRPGGETRTSRAARRSGGPFEVTEAQKAQFRTVATEEISEELSESGRFTMVSQPGSDVLLVSVQLLDVISKIPPEEPGNQRFFLSEFGEATLVLELRDSATEAVLARVIERHTAENLNRSVDLGIPPTQEDQVQNLFANFARMLRRRLDELGELGP